MPPLLIPVVTLVIALAGLVLAIFALVLITAQRLDNAQLPAHRRSDRDPDDANARALFGRSDFRPRPFRMSDTEPFPLPDALADRFRNRFTDPKTNPDPHTDAEPFTDTHTDAAVANAKPDAHGYCDPKPFADTDVFADFISISDPKTVYLTDFKSDRDS